MRVSGVQYPHELGALHLPTGKIGKVVEKAELLPGSGWQQKGGVNDTPGVGLEEGVAACRDGGHEKNLEEPSLTFLLSKLEEAEAIT